MFNYKGYTIMKNGKAWQVWFKGEMVAAETSKETAETFIDNL